jgi:hypothetical protein
MKEKPAIGTTVVVLTREHDGTPTKVKSTISNVHGQWLYVEGYPNARWHWNDDRKNDTVWKNKSGAIKVF